MVGGINLFVYAGNNPVNLTDPLGLDATGPNEHSCARDLSEGGKAIVKLAKIKEGVIWAGFGYPIYPFFGYYHNVYILEPFELHPCPRANG